MMDFSTLQGLTIPEGNVTQITDAAGQVLWELAQDVTVTITGNGSGYASVTIDGVTYNSPTTLVVPTGTIVTCTFSKDSKAPSKLNYGVYVGGTRVATASPYLYTIVGDTSIALSRTYETDNYDTYYGGKIAITES